MYEIRPIIDIWKLCVIIRIIKIEYYLSETFFFKFNLVSLTSDRDD